MSKPERRLGARELRLESDSANGRRLTGYAAVFESLSENLGGFREKIARGAFAKSIRTADVRLLVNHEGLPLARTTTGTLRLQEDTLGLRIEARLDPTDPDVQRVVPKLERGDLSQMSFGFFVRKDSWDRSNPSGPIRVLHEIDLFDVSLVTYPAYLSTSATVRSPADVWRAAQGGSAGERERKLTLLRHGMDILNDPRMHATAAERAAHLRRMKLAWHAPGGRGGLKV